MRAEFWRTEKRPDGIRDGPGTVSPLAPPAPRADDRDLVSFDVSSRIRQRREAMFHPLSAGNAPACVSHIDDTPMEPVKVHDHRRVPA